MPSSSPSIISAPKTTDFYQVADAAGVPVVHMALPQLGSVAIESGGKGVIGLDSSRATTHVLLWDGSVLAQMENTPESTYFVT